MSLLRRRMMMQQQEGSEEMGKWVDCGTVTLNEPGDRIEIKGLQASKKIRVVLLVAGEGGDKGIRFSFNGGEQVGGCYVISGQCIGEELGATVIEFTIDTINGINLLNSSTFKSPKDNLLNAGNARGMFGIRFNYSEFESILLESVNTRFIAGSAMKVERWEE